jgi:hypothetical protein
MNATATRLSNGATNYLRDCFRLSSVDRMTSEQAASLCENAEIDNTSEDAELWREYCRIHNQNPNQSVEKFRNSKFYREHL